MRLLDPLSLYLASDVLYVLLEALDLGGFVPLPRRPLIYVTL